eukprot:TRINITY_DN32912_c0_g1_i1.p1 TRINITY_DN32912_c0_g1~~TRINITY_DN32912_c0_g1_i1.p1  ORF type:complete len:394 (+),score=65.05 TRINITY_DN32912_c0_g1_i1:130-1311(+)
MCLARSAGLRGNLSLSCTSLDRSESHAGTVLPRSPKKHGHGGHGGVAVDLPWPKLATLEWPPPPSPLGTTRKQMAYSASRTTIGSEHDPWLEDEEDLRKSSMRPVEVRNRSELWQLRLEIEREKLKHVVPFPFFGQAMRFQDDCSVLQITDDGRFSYSSLEVQDPSETGRASTPEQNIPRTRNVITYEGVLVATPDSEKSADNEESTQGDEVVATIEGRGMARHEIDEFGGKTQLVNVERGVFRFAITVNPYFKPNAASVMPMLPPRLPGKPPIRKKLLPYIGEGVPKGSVSPRVLTPVRATLRQLVQERRRAPKLKFSVSHGSLLKKTGGFSLEGSEERKRPSMMINSASAPTLPALGDNGKTGQAAEAPKSVEDWREFYRDRAAKLFGQYG